MTKLLKEQFVQDCISNYLSKLGYHKQEPKGLREHGVDIKVKHKNFGRYYLVEVKGDPGKDVKSPGGSRNSCMNSAIGQIIPECIPTAKGAINMVTNTASVSRFLLRKELLTKYPTMSATN